MPDAISRLNAALDGRYKIQRLLGEGSMANVYLAMDLKHDREVAFKVLKPEVSSTLGPDRFLLEIKTTAQLNHPNILPLIDSGSADGFLYYVMPYVAGESLRERLTNERQLPVDDAKRIVEQVASALDFAHGRGVIHRDIKPANILLHEGVAMVADFGIAFAVSAAGGDRMTEIGLSLGTPHYMSPEQAVGDEDFDGRADQYSLACVLYEMLAGDPPFTGRNTRALLTSHIMDPVPALSTVRAGVDSATTKAISKALAKTPAERFATPMAFVQALRETESSQGGATSIAVLPLANLSGDPQQEYFSDGMTEALITDLAKIGALKVISRTSVMRFKGSNTPLPDIARELGVNTILEGSVLTAGDEVRITVQLIDASTDTHLWAESYNRQLTSILSLQGEVARTVAEQVKVKLTPQEEARLTNRMAVTPAAHQAYLEGRFLWNQRGPNLERSIPFFEEAVSHDPDYAPAYAGLADAYALIGFYGMQPLDAVMDKARQAATTALELAPNLAEAHASLGYIHLVYDWDWDKSGRELRRAIELNPSYAPARIWHAVWLLHVRGPEDAVSELHRGLEYDPLSVSIRFHMAFFLSMLDRFEDMEASARDALELVPGYSLARGLLGLALHAQSRTEEGIRELEQAAAESGREQWVVGMLGTVYADIGEPEKARAIAAELEARAETEFVSPIHVAVLHAAARDIEPALTWLYRAYDERAPLITSIRLSCYPGRALSTLSDEPRFQELMQRLDAQIPSLAPTGERP